MLSKWQIWDFFSSFEKDYLARADGLIALHTFDPLCLRMVRDYLMKGAADKIVHLKLGSEISRSWIEEEFQTLSLFGDSDSFFIHGAQDISADVLDFFLKQEISGRFVVLSFDQESSGWKKILKENSINALFVEAPRFWELHKLLDFVCTYLRLPLSYEAKTWIMEAQENNLSTFYNNACLIKLNHPESREVGLKEVQELLSVEKVDQFALASLLARKKDKEFFSKLVSVEGDFDKMRSLFNFLQSHLIKMADPTYLEGKPRLTQYDKDIQNTGKLWKGPELMKLITLFNEWEILSKKKDSTLWTFIREAQLRSYQNLSV